MTPGEQLREWRLTEGWTVYRLAAELRCSPVTVHNWQSGRGRPCGWRREHIEALTGIAADSWPAPGIPEGAKEQRRALYWRRRDAGLCVDCEEPTSGTARCEPCLEHRRPAKKPRKPRAPKPKPVPRLDPDRRRVVRGVSWVQVWREQRRAS